MFRSTLRMVIVSTFALTGAVVAGNWTPASAFCSTGLFTYSRSVVNSTTLTASPSCDGMWANGANTPDYVRGWYLKDGIWQNSEYGWQYIGNGSKKIIGNTVTDRKLRGQGLNFSQLVNTTL